MHWLESLDKALFHFINSTLANPFFDWLMPVLSGNGVPWLAAIIIAVPCVLIWGSTRLKLCALMLVLVVSIGDGLVINTVKKSVERPRPFVTQPDARLFGEVGKGYVQPLPDGSLPPKANRRSMPSAHSANWFAMATVAFLFYRRSAKFMFPLAAAVAFSRVYNGVHYPTDVTAGAILGMGYAIALLIATQSLWSFFGKRFFPAWHEQLPSLLNPAPRAQTPDRFKSEIRNPKSEIEWLHLGYFVIVVALIARWIYLKNGPLDLSGDEAYQWTWSKHLALSYYSKPLGIALFQKLGTLIGGDTTFGVRFCSPLLAAIMGFMMLRFLAREAGPRLAFWVLIATLATPLLCAGSVLMTIDPPLVLCWMWATIAGWRALQPDGKTRDWLIVGLAIGLGFLCKYTAALQLVCWVILFALMPTARKHLRKRGPWLALGVFALCTLPVIIWNAQHDWVTLTHVKANAKLDQEWHPTLKYFVEFFFGQAGFLNPVFFFAMIWASFAFWKRRAEKPLWLFLACMGAPLFYGYWLYSFHSRVQANWPIAAVPPLFCLAALYWQERPVAAKRLLIIGLVIGLPVVALLHDTGLTKVLVAKLPGDVDIAHRTDGWRETAQVVELERQKFDTNAFIIADDYGATGLYSIYSPAARAAVGSPEPLVYCFRGNLAGNQFYFWDEYDYQKYRHGQNAIYVDHLDAYKPEHGWLWKWLRREPIGYRDLPPTDRLPKQLAEQFETVTNLGIREIPIQDGRIFHRVQIFGCYGLK
ncbi:MAG TPA: glycosyltransferase family 39 protein [bacterium]|nr:glycosyltransferase family 39 protein [bacterium]